MTLQYKLITYAYIKSQKGDHLNIKTTAKLTVEVGTKTVRFAYAHVRLVSRHM
jgi:hypothetical protein